MRPYSAITLQVFEKSSGVVPMHLTTSTYLPSIGLLYRVLSPVNAAAALEALIARSRLPNANAR